jgi:hypothetical protein
MRSAPMLTARPQPVGRSDTRMTHVVSNERSANSLISNGLGREAERGDAEQCARSSLSTQRWLFASARCLAWSAFACPADDSSQMVNGRRWVAKDDVRKWLRGHVCVAGRASQLVFTRTSSIAW